MVEKLLGGGDVLAMIERMLDGTRLELASGDVADALDDTGKRVRDLLAKRGDAQAAVGTELTAAQEALAKLEQERAAQHSVVDAAEKEVDAAAADAQRHLKADAAYGAQLDKAHASDRVAATADEKAR